MQVINNWRMAWNLLFPHPEGKPRAGSLCLQNMVEIKEAAYQKACEKCAPVIQSNSRADLEQKGSPKDGPNSALMEHFVGKDRITDSAWTFQGEYKTWSGWQGVSTQDPLVQIKWHHHLKGGTNGRPLHVSLQILRFKRRLQKKVKYLNKTHASKEQPYWY